MSRLLNISRLLDVPVGVAYHVVSALATWLAPMPGGLASAAAIVVFTVAVRLALLPLSYYAIRGEGARTRLMPRFQDLQRRYSGQPERLRRELSALHRAEGAGLFAGGLPLLLQLPFLSVMYRLFLSPEIHGSPNTLLTHHLLGVPLASHLLSGPGPFSHQGVVFMGMLALLGVVAALSTRMASGQGAAKPSGALSVLTRLMPYGTLLVAAVVPLAAGVYLLTTAGWTVLERSAIRSRLHNGSAA
jgi:YidC/Oxa1 family membrane protein insertase